MDTDEIAAKEHKEHKSHLPLRLDRADSDATLAHRMGGGLGVRALVRC